MREASPIEKIYLVHLVHFSPPKARRMDELSPEGSGGSGDHSSKVCVWWFVCGSNESKCAKLVSFHHSLCYRVYNIPVIFLLFPVLFLL